MSYFSNFSNSEFSYNIKPRGFNSINYTQSTFNNTNNNKTLDFDFDKFKYDISFKKYPENIDLYNSFLRRGYRKYANSISQFYFQILPEENFIKAENNYLKKRIDELTNLLREKDKIINQMNNNKLINNNQNLNTFYNTYPNKTENNNSNNIEIENQTLKIENENLKHNINLLTNKITNMKSQKPSYFIGYSDAENIVNNDNYKNYKNNKIDIYKRTNEIFNSNKNWDNITTPINTNKRVLYNNENNKINLNEINTPIKNYNHNINSYNNNCQIDNNNIYDQPLYTFGNNLNNKIDIQTLTDNSIKSNDISSIKKNSKQKITNKKIHENINSFNNDLRITNLMFTDLLKDVKERLRSHSCNSDFRYIQDDNLNSLKIKKVTKNNMLNNEKRSVSTNNIFIENNS